MKHLRTLLCLLAIFAVTPRHAHAQGGSPYNLIGFGTPLPSATPVTEALGGAAAALRNPFAISEANPADWTWIDRARFETALRYDYSDFQFSSTSGREHNVFFNGLRFAAPFWSAEHAALSIGYLPLTTASYELTNADSTATRTYQSRGGANLGYIGAAMQPLAGVAVGARLDLVFGNIRHVDQVEFTKGTSVSSEFERDYYFHGLRPTIGLQFFGDSVGSALRNLTIGAVWSGSVSMGASRETVITPVSSSLDTTIVAEGDAAYPSSLLVGLGYKFTDRYRILADYFMQDWSNAYVYPGETSFGHMTMSNRISIGLERIANPRSEYGTSYGFDRWGLRLGFYMAKLPFTPNFNTAGVNFEGGTVNEMAITAGLGIPFSNDMMLNISAVGGQRTPSDLNVAPKETFLRLGASVSLSEQWFVPTRPSE